MLSIAVLAVVSVEIQRTPALANQVPPKFALRYSAVVSSSTSYDCTGLNAGAVRDAS